MRILLPSLAALLLAQLGRIDLVFKDGIAYDPKKLVDSVRGKIGR